ncbi:MAG: DUF423 domain-containing protein [Pseudomonadota bacterium]
MNLASVGGVLGVLAISLGTLGVHGLGGRMSEQAQGWWETGTMYLLVHAVAVLALGLADKDWHRAGWFFAPGAAIFAGTLYAMALGGPRWLGAVTPVGGTLMLFGWGAVFILGMVKSRSS